MSTPADGAARARSAAFQQANGPAAAQSPWQGQPDSAAGIAAVFNLFNALQARLTLQGRLHPPTCLAAIGTIAGFSAQRVLFEDPRNAASLKQIRTAKTRTGSEYYSGEPLNRMLVPAPHAENDRLLWSLAAAGALNAGLPRSALPDPGELFAHVVTALVGEAAGWPSVDAAHQPHMNGRETLQIVWPVALDCFNGRLPHGRSAQPVALRHWPVIAGRLAGTLIERMATTVHPRTALILIMESAIYASKVKPEVAGAMTAQRPFQDAQADDALEYGV